jgi:endonuclease/exonuclease/phosphatase family metal-dependent hydrolase
MEWNLHSYDGPTTAQYLGLKRIVQAMSPKVLLFEEANDTSGRNQFIADFCGAGKAYPYGYYDPSTASPRNQIWSAYPITASGQIWSNYASGSKFSRPVIWADLDVLPGEAGSELRVYCAHWKAYPDDPDSQLLRLNEATDSSDHIVAFIAANPAARIFYAGDLNDFPSTPPLNKITEARTTLSRLNMTDPNNGSTVTYWNYSPPSILDHMLCSATLAGHVSGTMILHTETYAAGQIPAPALAADSETASDHLALLATLDIQPPPPILINEVSLRQAAPTETLEFIELQGAAGQSLSGLSVVVIEGEAGQNPGRVDAVWALSGAMPAGGYYLLGDSALSPDWTIGGSSVLENGTQTILLVQNTTATLGEDVDTNDDGTADVTIGTIKDSIALRDAAAGGRTYFSAPVFGPVLGSLPAGAARCPNAVDTNTTADWLPLSLTQDGVDGGVVPTPRAANAVLSADFNTDCSVDVQDVAHFAGCATGAAVPQTTPGCADTDLDDDGDTDLDDFGLLQRQLTH